MHASFIFIITLWFWSIYFSHVIALNNTYHTIVIIIIIIICYKGKLDESLGGGQFDSSNNFSFECGGGDVVKGMDESVLGMKIGGKRSVR